MEEEQKIKWPRPSYQFILFGALLFSISFFAVLYFNFVFQNNVKEELEAAGYYAILYFPVIMPAIINSLSISAILPIPVLFVRTVRVQRVMSICYAVASVILLVYIPKYMKYVSAVYIFAYPENRIDGPDTDFGRYGTDIEEVLDPTDPTLLTIKFILYSGAVLIGIGAFLRLRMKDGSSSTERSNKT